MSEEDKNVIIIRNMVSPDEVDDELKTDIEG
jgi:hypothetical protein